MDLAHAHARLGHIVPHQPDSTGNKYEYQDLADAETDLRLLKICTSDQLQSELHLELWHVKLEDAPTYLALSYTWDSPDEDLPTEWSDPNALRYICINGKRFGVRLNLFHALAAIRTYWSTATGWWIDAICINQTNIQERNAQVARMNNIYRNAMATCIWLGPPNDLTPAAALKVKEISESYDERSGPLRSFRVPDENLVEYSNIVREEFGDADPTQLWECVRDLLSRSWWKRTWIVQELCTSSGAVLFSGPYKFTWSQLVSVYQVVCQHAMSLRKVKGIELGLAQEVISVLLLSMSVFQDLQDLQTTYRSQIEREKLPQLQVVLRRLRNRSATDPKDKVFAGLGLTEGGDKFKIDYTMTVEEVFMNAAWHCMMSSKDLSIFGYCKIPSVLAKLPSWVPDWTDQSAEYRVPLGHEILAAATEEAFYCAGGLVDSGNITFYAKAGVLEVDGDLHDTIDFRATWKHDIPDGSYFKSGYLEDRLIIQYHEDLSKNEDEVHNIISNRKWLRDWHEHYRTNAKTYSLIEIRSLEGKSEGAAQQLELLDYVPTKETLEEAYFRTLCADLFLDTPDGVQKRYSQYYDNRLRGDSNDVLHSIAARLTHKVFAVTTMGYLALVPPETEVGDIVTVIKGNAVPLILRITTTGYTVIGESYVHGIMDGELFEILTDYRFTPIPLV